MNQDHLDPKPEETNPRDTNLRTNPIFDSPRGQRSLTNEETGEETEQRDDDTPTARANPIFDSPRGRD